MKSHELENQQTAPQICCWMCKTPMDTARDEKAYGWIARCPKCQPVTAPAKPRRMQGNPDCWAGDYHNVEHDETATCPRWPACQPADPAPAFEAKVCAVDVDERGNCCLTTMFGAAYLGAPHHVGDGIGDSYTVAAFCEDKAEAEMSVESYQRTGRLICLLLHSDPIFQGKLLPFAVAVKVIV